MDCSNAPWRVPKVVRQYVRDKQTALALVPGIDFVNHASSPLVCPRPFHPHNAEILNGRNLRWSPDPKS